MEKESLMKKIESEEEDDLRPEYDFSHKKGGMRGKYVERCREGTNLVLLAPDIAAAFPDAKAVNDALRLVLRRRYNYDLIQLVDDFVSREDQDRATLVRKSECVTNGSRRASPLASRTAPGTMGLITPSSPASHAPLTRIDAVPFLAQDVAHVRHFVRMSAVPR